MDKRRLAILLFALDIFTMLSFVFLAVYHIFADEPLWGFPVWIVADVVLFFAIKGIKAKCNIQYGQMFGDATKQKKFEDISNVVFGVIVAIILLPITLVLVVDSLCFAYATRQKKIFEPLLQKGFGLQKDKQNHCYLLQKQNVVVAFSFDENDYTTSFDGGKSFVDVVDSTLGTSCERQILQNVQQTYKDALPVEKQRFEVDIPTEKFVSFLARWLD